MSGKPPVYRACYSVVCTSLEQGWPNGYHWTGTVDEPCPRCGALSPYYAARAMARFNREMDELQGIVERARRL